MIREKARSDTETIESTAKRTVLRQLRVREKEDSTLVNSIDALDILHTTEVVGFLLSSV